MKTIMSDFTPVQSRMLAILSDGEAHSRKELHRCLEDDLGPLSNIKAHLTSIRKQLRPRGEDIICEIRGHEVYYRHIRLTETED